VHRDSFTFHPNRKHFLIYYLKKEVGLTVINKVEHVLYRQYPENVKLVEQPTLYAGKYVCVVYLSYLNFNLYFEPHKISESPEC
jgi:hypothetical protein